MKYKDTSQDRYHTDTTEDLLCTSSATDCTGLIPAGITDDELEAMNSSTPTCLSAPEILSIKNIGTKKRSKIVFITTRASSRHADIVLADSCGEKPK